MTDERVRGGFALLSKLRTPMLDDTPEPTWVDAQRVVTVWRVGPFGEPGTDMRLAWTNLILEPPNEALMVLELPDEVIDLVAEARRQVER